MATTMLTWGGKTLSVDAKTLTPMEDLSFGGSMKTKESDQSGVHKAETDGLNAAKYSCTAILDARLGVNVVGEVRSWMSHMRSGTKSNLQIAGQDIFGVPFLLTKCEAKDVRLTGTGAWLKATLELEFEECAVHVAASSSSSSSSSGGSSGGGGSSSSSKSSSSSSSSKGSSSSASKSNASSATAAKNAIKSSITNAKNAALSALKTATSSTTKKTTTTSSVNKNTKQMMY